MLSLNMRLLQERQDSSGPMKVKNPNEEHDKGLTFGDRVADRFAELMGSWPFIIAQSILLACWIAVNVAAVAWRWDPYPFILLNLALSFQAAYAAPIIMMSQNRQSAKDRLTARLDYEVNLKAERELAEVRQLLLEQGAVLAQLSSQLSDVLNSSHGKQGEGR